MDTRSTKPLLRDWPQVAAFYRELIDVHKWDQQPMLDFITWLADSDYARLLYPSMSHESLLISLVPTYEERLKAPVVFIKYKGSLNQFRVYYNQWQGNPVLRDSFEPPLSPERFSRILQFLGVRAADSFS